MKLKELKDILAKYSDDQLESGVIQMTFPDGCCAEVYYLDVADIKDNVIDDKLYVTIDSYDQVPGYTSCRSSRVTRDLHEKKITGEPNE